MCSRPHETLTAESTLLSGVVAQVVLKDVSLRVAHANAEHADDLAPRERDVLGAPDEDSASMRGGGVRGLLGMAALAPRLKCACHTVHPKRVPRRLGQIYDVDDSFQPKHLCQQARPGGLCPPICIWHVSLSLSRVRRLCMCTPS